MRTCRNCYIYDDCEWVAAAYGSIEWVYWCTPEMAQRFADMLAVVCPNYVQNKCEMCGDPVSPNDLLCEGCYHWLRELQA